MYTRSYFTEDKKIDIPENYDGNAFKENGSVIQNAEEVLSDFKEEPNDVQEETEETLGKGIFSSLFDKLPVKSLQKGFPFSLFKKNGVEGCGLSFGTEEILISLIAIYMFFSKDGDKECAAFILLLLFID